MYIWWARRQCNVAFILIPASYWNPKRSRYGYFRPIPASLLKQRIGTKTNLMESRFHTFLVTGPWRPSHSLSSLHCTSEIDDPVVGLRDGVFFFFFFVGGVGMCSRENSSDWACGWTATIQHSHLWKGTDRVRRPLQDLWAWSDGILAFETWCPDWKV